MGDIGGVYLVHPEKGLLHGEQLMTLGMPYIRYLIYAQALPQLVETLKVAFPEADVGYLDYRQATHLSESAVVHEPNR